MQELFNSDLFEAIVGGALGGVLFLLLNWLFSLRDEEPPTALREYRTPKPVMPTPRSAGIPKPPAPAPFDPIMRGTTNMQWIIKAFLRIPDAHKIYFILAVIAAAVILVAMGYGAGLLAFIMGG